jgi:hypothetical protein
VFDKGTTVQYDTTNTNKAREEKKLNESFVVAVIALNSSKVWSCAIIRPKSNSVSQHEEFTTTTRCYVPSDVAADKMSSDSGSEAEIPTHIGLRASIGGLLQSFKDDHMNERDVWMLKFLADRLATIPTILQGDGKMPNDVVLMTATHDMRAWLDIYKTRLLDNAGEESIIKPFCVFTRTVGFTSDRIPIRLFIANIPPQHLTDHQMEQIKQENLQTLENERMQLLKSIKQKFKDTAIPLAKTVPFRNRIKYFFKKTQYPTLAEVMDICKKFIKLHEPKIGNQTKDAINTYIEFFNFTLDTDTTDERVNVEKPECSVIKEQLELLLNQPQLGGTHKTHKTLKNKNGITKNKILKYKKYRTQHKVLRNKRFTLKQK